MAVPRSWALGVGVLIVAMVLPEVAQADADIYVICEKTLKPSPPTDPRVVSNKMGEKFAEVKVTFGHPQGTNNKLGCATLYRIELMEGNKVVMRENGLEPANPLVTEVSFTRRVLPGATHKYRITAINTNTKPPLESAPAFTEVFTTASGPPAPTAAAAATTTSAAVQMPATAVPKPAAPAAKP